MDDLRDLDVRCAELLGWNKTIYEDMPGIGTVTTVRLRNINFSSDPAACAELDGEARQEGFTLYLWYDRHGVWVACYLREDEQPNWLIWEFGDTEWEARVKAFIAAKERTDRAVVRALEGSGEK